MTRQNRTPLPGSESFTSLGEVWHLAPLGPRFTDAYSAWCRMRARRSTDRDKAFMTPEEYADEKRLTKLQIDAGEYEWGPPPQMQGTGMAPGIVAVFNSDPGRLQLLRLLLEPAHGELTDAEITAIAEDSGEGLKNAFDAVFFSQYPWLRPAGKTAENSDLSSGPAPAPNPGATPTP